jgi:phage-related baseplate assembly protein
MLTDGVTIKDAFIINIGVNFDIVVRPNYNGKLVLNNCLTSLQSYFNIDKWQINQPIILSEIYNLLGQIDGVQTVQKVTITNNAGTNSGYSQYSYDIKGATINNIIYPSLDPSIFEVKNLTSDIQGRVVTF